MKKKTPEIKKNAYKMHIKVPTGQTEVLKNQLSQQGISLADSEYDDSKGILTVGSTDTDSRKKIRSALKSVNPKLNTTVKQTKEPKYLKSPRKKSQKDFDL